MRRRLEEFLLVYGAMLAAYLATNAWQWRPPVLVRELPPDRWVPFLGWSVWIYASHLLLLPAAALSISDSAAFRRLMRCVAVSTAVSCGAFLAFPTAVPRDVPLPEGASGAVFALLYAANTPVNSLPSMHVSLVYLAALSLRDAGLRWWPAAAGWATLIAVSTMTTKEHYFLDVLGGLAVTAACRWVTSAGRWEALAAAAGAGAAPGRGGDAAAERMA